MKIQGIHHISSIVGHAQKNLDFYAGVLGMRLVKKTLNFDDSSTYHFYYGNEAGSTNLLTTFPWNDADNGDVGAGQVGVTSLAVNKGTFPFWKERLTKFKVDYNEYERFGIKRLAFEDMDGLLYELIESDHLPNSNWEFNGVNKDNAIKGIDSAYLYSRVPHATLKLLTEVFNYEIVDDTFDTYLLKVNDELGGMLELNKATHDPSRQGVGTVHHIALAINDGDEEAWLEKIIEAGYKPTEVKDRKYFKSIYFREKGGILIELASLSPGVLVDETIETLGHQLLIPPHFDIISEEIEKTIMPVSVREVDELVGYGYRDKYEYDLLRQRETVKREILKLKSKDNFDDSDAEELQRLKNKLFSI